MSDDWLDDEDEEDLEDRDAYDLLNDIYDGIITDPDVIERVKEELDEPGNGGIMLDIAENTTRHDDPDRLSILSEALDRALEMGFMDNNEISAAHSIVSDLYKTGRMDGAVSHIASFMNHEALVGDPEYRAYAEELKSRTREFLMLDELARTEVLDRLEELVEEHEDKELVGHFAEARKVLEALIDEPQIPADELFRRDSRPEGDGE